MTINDYASAAAAAREAARTTTGQFGTQPLSEADLDLTGAAFIDPLTTGPNVWTEDDEAELAECEMLQVAEIGPGLAGHLTREVDQCATPAGKRLMMRALTDRSHPLRLTGHSTYDIREHADMDALGAMGYQTKEDFTDAANLQATRPRDIIEANLTVERAAELRAAGVTKVHYPQSKWLTETMAMAEVDDIAAAMQISDEEKRWQTMVGLTDGDRAERAAEFFGAGERTVHWIESGLPLQQLQEVRDALPASKHGEHQRKADAQYIVKKGLTAQEVKAYGPKVCNYRSKADIDAWDATKHKPAVLKSLHNRASSREIGELITLADGGVTKGADLAVYQDVLADGRPEAIVAAAKHLTAQQTGVWAEANVSRVLSQDEVEGAAKLVAGGYQGPREVMIAYKDAFFPAASEADHKSQNAKPLVAFGDAVAAGATPEKVQAMTRAGIPPVKIAEHVNDADYWATGAAYRERHAKQMAREREWGFHTKPSEWPITEEDYRSGA